MDIRHSPTPPQYLFLLKNVNQGLMINTKIMGLESKMSSLKNSGNIDRELEEFLSDLVDVLKDQDRKLQENERRFNTFM